MLLDGLTLTEGAVIENLTCAVGASDPADPSTGELFFRTDLGELRVYTGAAWESVGTGAFTASITGDLTGTIDGGTDALTLATVNGNVGTFGAAASVPVITVNAKGLVTAVGTAAVAAPAATLTGTTLAAGVTDSSLTSVDTITTGVWAATPVALTSGGTGQVTAAAALNALLPTQTGQGGRYLSTDGSTPAWAAVSVSAPLTATHVGYGGVGDTLTGSALLTFSAAARTLQLGTGTGAAVLRTEDSAAGAANASLTIRTGDGASGASSAGTLTLRGGDGPAGGSAGGDVVLTAGDVLSGAAQAGRVLVASGVGGTPGYLQIDTAGTERLRVLASGAWSVGTGGSATGTSGQVLASAGSGAPPAWTTVGGGTVTSVAVTPPTAGFTITGGPITTSGTLAFTLSDDLAGLEAVTGAGLAARTATDTWTARTLTGTSNRLTVVNGDGVGGDPTLDVAATYVGQASITTLGTITTGTWTGTTIALANGGTGQTSAVAALNALLPTQAGQGGRYLTTDGANASWATVAGGGSLTATYVGYGDGANALTGTSNLTWITGSNQLQLGVGTGLSTLRTANAVSGANAASLTIRTGDANAGVVGAGALTLQAGTGATGTTGGDVAINAGTAGGGTAGQITFSTAGTTRLTISNAGAVSLGTNTLSGITTLTASNTLSGLRLLLNSTTGTAPVDGLHLSATNTMELVTNSTSRLTIGTTSAGFALPLLAQSFRPTGTTAPTDGMYRPTSPSAVVRFAFSSADRWQYGTAALAPSSDNSYSLGESGGRWSVVFSATGTINTSDARTKNDVLASDLGLGFINALRPVSFRFNVGRNVVSEDGLNVVTPVAGTRRHYGLLAQEVQATLAMLGKGGADFAGWCLDDSDDPDSGQGLRYDQFIAPLIQAVQELSAQVTALEARLTVLEG